MIKEIIKKSIWYLLTIIALIVVFYLIKHSSIYSKIFAFDYKVIQVLGSKYDERIVATMKFITMFGDIFIPLGIIITCSIFLKNKLFSVALACNYLFVGLISFVTKYIIARPRPFIALIDMPTSFSFPSGHTLTALSFFFVFSYLLTMKSDSLTRTIYFMLFSLLVIFIGISRLYLGVHFFSDVVGSIILGIPCVLFAVSIIKVLRKYEVL